MDTIKKQQRKISKREIVAIVISLGEDFESPRKNEIRLF